MNPAQLKALKHIKSELDAGLLGATRHGTCIYEDEATGKRCAIGCLLSRETLDEIHLEEWNEDIDVDGLIHRSPRAKTEIPFTERQAMALQAWHDSSFDHPGPLATVMPPTQEEFGEILNMLISGELTEIGTGPASKFRISF